MKELALHRETKSNTKIGPDTFYGTLDTLKIPDDTFTSDTSSVVERAVELCVRYDVSPHKFVADSERSLLLLSLIDLAMERNIKEFDETVLYELLRTKTASERPGQMLDDAIKNYQFMEEMNGQCNIVPILDINDIDEEKSIDLAREMEKWGITSRLHRTRQNIGVTRDNEFPYSVSVLGLKKKAFEEYYNASAFVTNSFDKPMIVLPRNYDFHLLDHEYIHTQQVGFNSHLFEGITEGCVESSTPYPDPRLYGKEMHMYKILLHQNPELKGVLNAALRSQDKTDFYTFIVSKYGMVGLASLALMVPMSEKKLESHGSFYGNGYWMSSFAALESMLQHRQE